MAACDTNTCTKNFIDKDCMCYQTVSGDDSEQVCGFIAEDGLLYKCDKGCCEPGCPGQCPEQPARPAQASYVPMGYGNQKFRSQELIKDISYVSVILIFLSTISLFIGDTSYTTITVVLVAILLLLVKWA